MKRIIVVAAVVMAMSSGIAMAQSPATPPKAPSLEQQVADLTVSNIQNLINIEAMKMDKAGCFTMNGNIETLKKQLDQATKKAVSLKGGK